METLKNYSSDKIYISFQKNSNSDKKFSKLIKIKDFSKSKLKKKFIEN
jgi:hypothetical protein